MSVVLDINGIAGTNQNDSPRERMKKAAEDGDIERLYELIAIDPHILEHFDKVPFCETPLHIAAAKGKTHFAIELMTLKPSLALKLNPSGLSPIHLAFQNNHIQTARGLIAIDNSLVSIKGKGRITPLHHVARIGDSDLLSEFLCYCPSSIEDLTTKRETVVHIAVKNHQVETFKVILGWIKRVYREEILNWKDEDGNTILHIAASLNQTQVMELLHGIVKKNAKNLDGKTAMDILRTHQIPLPPEARSTFHSANGTTTTLAKYLSQELTLSEKLNNHFGLINLSKTRNRVEESNDSRGVILVVAVLIATATYQASLSPPGGFWQDDSKPDDKKMHSAGHMVMSYVEAISFCFPNGIAFFLSLYVIMILTSGFPMWGPIVCSVMFLVMANFISLFCTFPKRFSDSSFSDEDIMLVVFIMAYVVIAMFTLLAPLYESLLNWSRRRQVDFPDKYFSSPHYNDLV